MHPFSELLFPSSGKASCVMWVEHLDYLILFIYAEVQPGNRWPTCGLNRVCTALQPLTYSAKFWWDLHLLRGMSCNWRAVFFLTFVVVQIEKNFKVPLHSCWNAQHYPLSLSIFALAFLIGEHFIPNTADSVRPASKWNCQGSRSIFFSGIPKGRREKKSNKENMPYFEWVMGPFGTAQHLYSWINYEVSLTWLSAFKKNDWSVLVSVLYQSSTQSLFPGCWGIFVHSGIG